MLMAEESSPGTGRLPKGLLPNGSQLQSVMLPRYDEHRNLVGVLKAEAMTLVNDTQVEGRKVSIEMFNPDHSPKARIDLTKAIIYQDKNLLVAKEAVEIKSDRITARGSGLYYDFALSEGFLPGPATTIIQASTETTMNSPSSKLRATALAGAALMAQPLNAAPPPAPTAEEKAALQADAVSKAPEAAEANKIARSDLRETLKNSEEANKAAAAFLDKADLLAAESKTDPVAEPKPLDVKPGPDTSVITCDGGIYFDADAGVLVYLKNVKVTDPRFDMTGANELKIFFGKKPVKEPTEVPAAPDKKSKDPIGSNGFGKMGASIGDVERVVATGAVLLKQKNVQGGKEPINASGAVFSYNVKTGDIVISGGYPWFTQGTTYLRAREPQLSLRIDKDSNAVTEGQWDMGGNPNQKK